MDSSPRTDRDMMCAPAGRMARAVTAEPRVGAGWYLAWHTNMQNASLKNMERKFVITLRHRVHEASGPGPVMFARKVDAKLAASVAAKQRRVLSARFPASSASTTSTTVRYGFIKIRMKVVNFIKKIFIKNHFHQKPLSSKTTLIKTTLIRTTLIKIHFHQEPLSSKTTFIKNHFHQNPLSSRTTFIKNHFHQKPLSSKTTFIKNHFHQKPLSSKTIFIKKPQTLNP